MTDTKEIYDYDAKFIYDMANAIADQLDFKKSAVKQELGSDQKNDSIEIDTKNLDAEQREFFAVLKDPENISNLDDAQIKQLYKELKVKFSADKEDKKYFKKVNKNVKAMIKSDKHRTNMRYVKKAGKYTATLGALTAGFFALMGGFYPLIPTRIEEIPLAIQLSLASLHRRAPEAETALIGMGLGIAVYAGAKTVIKLQDLKTLRRITCKAIAEELDVSDVIRLKQAAKEMGINDIKEFYPLAELCQENKQKRENNKTSVKVKNDDEMER